MSLTCLILTTDGAPPARIGDFLSQARFLEPVGVFADPAEALALHVARHVNYWLIDLPLAQDSLRLVGQLEEGDRPRIVVFGAEEAYYLDRGGLDPAVFANVQAAEAMPALSPDTDASEAGAPVPRTGQGRYPGLLYIRTAKGIKRLRRSDLLVIEAQKDYLQLTARDAQYRVLRSMKSLEGRLDPRVHFRVHRSYIVLLDAIHTIDQEQIWLDGLSEPVPIGPNYRKELLARMEIL